MSTEQDAYTIGRARAVIEKGRNELQQAGPMPYAAVQLRTQYLSWRSQAEDMLAALGFDRSTIAQSQSPRHRDLVADRVPPEQMYREVNAERELLEEQLTRLVSAATTEVRSEVEPSLGIQGQSGNRYWYYFNQPLGRPGRHGSVFRGVDADERDIAVKRIDLPSGQNFRKQFTREIEIAERLSTIQSDYLMPILDWAWVSDALFIVMPLASRSLAEHIELYPKGLEADETRQILMEIASGLSDMHANKVIHRDIKPHNILYYDDRWRLADFGISRNLDVATATLTWNATGTIEYMAPEVFRSFTTNQSSDLYALGCVAYELVAGQPAFSGDNMASIHAQAVPSLPESTDPVIQTLIYDLLAKEPGARVASAGEVVRRLHGKRNVTPAQQRLREIHADNRRKNLELQSEAAQRSEISDEQRQARLRLSGIWKKATELAQDAVPEITSEATENFEWSLSLDSKHLVLRLNQQLPLAPSDILIVGWFDVLTTNDRHPQERPANVIAIRRENEMPLWYISQYAFEGSSSWRDLEPDQIRERDKAGSDASLMVERRAVLEPDHIVELLTGSLSPDGFDITPPRR